MEGEESGALTEREEEDTGSLIKREEGGGREREQCLESEREETKIERWGR